jgi:HK97 family phage prohead protease
MTTRGLKARAKAKGISSGRLWVAAKRIARDAAARPYGEPGTLIGYGAVFNQWKEVNTPLEGHYFERLAPGAFTKALESRQRMKCTYRHGKDPEFGYMSLGPITVLEEDEYGVYYEVQLLDADYTRALVPGLQAGRYRSSFTSEVLTRDLVQEPDLPLGRRVDLGAETRARAEIDLDAPLAEPSVLQGTQQMNIPTMTNL